MRRGFAARASKPVRRYPDLARQPERDREERGGERVERRQAAQIFGGGFGAHEADPPHDLRASCVILGWVTKVPLPLLTSTRPRSTKF
jgi:hypothetical protein